MWAEWVSGEKSWSLAVSSGSKVGNGISGGTHPVEWKYGRTPCVTSGKTRLQCWVVRALSSYNPPGTEVPLISVQIKSYPTFQSWGFECSGPFLKGTSIIPHYLSLNITLDNLHGRQWLHIGLSQVPRKSALLMPYTATLSLSLSSVKWYPETSKFFWGLFLTIILWTNRAIFINDNYKIFDVVMSKKSLLSPRVNYCMHCRSLIAPWSLFSFFNAEMFCTLKLSHFLSLASWGAKFPSFSGHWSFLKIKRIRQDRKHFLRSYRTDYLSNRIRCQQLCINSVMARVAINKRTKGIVDGSQCLESKEQKDSVPEFILG